MQIRDKNPEKSKKDVYTNFRKNSTMDISKQIQTSKEEKAIKDKLKELKDLQDMVGDGIDKIQGSSHKSTLVILVTFQLFI